jgi:hypothetical protein
VRPPLALLLASLALATPSRVAPKTEKHATVFWQGLSGGFYVWWSSADLTVTARNRVGETVFSFRG